MRVIKSAIVSIIVGNIFHLAAVIFFILRLNVTISEETFFRFFISFQLIDYLLNIVFFVLIIYQIEKYREEITVSSIFFIITSIFSRIAAAALLINFLNGDYYEYLPYFLATIMDFLLSNSNLIGLSSIFFSISIFYVSKTGIAESKESALQLVAILNGSLSLLYVIPDFTGGILYLWGSVLFLFKSLLIPFLMIAIFVLWFRELVSISESNTYQLAKAKGYPDLSTYKSKKELVISGKYPDYTTYINTVDIIEKYKYPNYEFYQQHHDDLIKGEFPNYKIYKDAIEYGITNYSTYKDQKLALKQGDFPNISALEKAKEAGFDNYIDFQKARSLGLKSEEEIKLFEIINRETGRNLGKIDFGTILDQTDISKDKLVTILGSLLTRGIIDGHIEMGQSKFRNNMVIVTDFGSVDKLHEFDIQRFIQLLKNLPINTPVPIEELVEEIDIDQPILEHWLFNVTNTNSNISKQLNYNNIRHTVTRISDNISIPSKEIAVLMSNTRHNDEEIIEQDELILIADDTMFQKQEELQERLFYSELLNTLTERLIDEEEHNVGNLLNEINTVIEVNRLAIYRKIKNTYQVFSSYGVTEEYLEFHYNIIAQELHKLVAYLNNEGEVVVSEKSNPDDIIKKMQFVDLIHTKADIQSVVFVIHNQNIVQYDIDKTRLSTIEINFLRKLGKVILNQQIT